MQLDDENTRQKIKNYCKQFKKNLEWNKNEIYILLCI